MTQPSNDNLHDLDLANQDPETDGWYDDGFVDLDYDPEDSNYLDGWWDDYPEIDLDDWDNYPEDDDDD